MDLFRHRSVFHHPKITNNVTLHSTLRAPIMSRLTLIYGAIMYSSLSESHNQPYYMGS